MANWHASQLATGILVIFLGISELNAQPPTKHVDHEGNPLPAEAVARIGSTRFRLGGNIGGLALSPDEKTLACISSDNSLNFLDAATGKLLRRFSVETEDGSFLQYPMNFSPDGKGLALITHGVYRLVEVQSGKDSRPPLKLQNTRYHQGEFSKDIKRVILEDEQSKNLKIFDLESGKTVCQLKFKGRRFLSAVFSPDGRSCFCSSSESDVIEVFDAVTGQLQMVLPQAEASHLAISPDGKLLAVVLAPLETKSVMIWDLDKQKLHCKVEATFAEFESVTAIKFSPSGKKVLFHCWGRNWSLLADADTGKPIQKLPFGNRTSIGIFTKDEKKLYSAPSDWVAIQPWDLQTGQAAKEGPVPRVAMMQSRNSHGGMVNHDGGLLIPGELMRIAEWRTGKIRRAYPVPDSDNGIRNILSPDEKTIAFVTSNREDNFEITLLETKTDKVIRTLPTGPRYPHYYHFSADGKTLICHAVKEELLAWDVASGKQRFQARNVRSIALSADRKQLAMSEKTPTGPVVHLWDLGQDKPRRTLALGDWLFDRMTISSDGKFLVFSNGVGQNIYGEVVTPESLVLVDLVKGKISKRWIGAKGGFAAMALSPDYRTLAGSEHGNQVTLWEIASGKPRHQFAQNASKPFGVTATLFNPDGTLLAAASADAPLLIWDVYGIHLNKNSAVEGWNDQDGQRWWDDLASENATRAFAAVRALVQNPGAALKLLAKRLQPAPEVNQRRFLDLVQDLGHDNFAKRKQALGELEKLADQVESWMVREAEGGHPLEVQRRLEGLLTKSEARGGPSLRGTRALEVLEHIGGPESDRLIARLAEGFPAARLTREAQETQARMKEKKNK